MKKSRILLSIILIIIMSLVTIFISCDNQEKKGLPSGEESNNNQEKVEMYYDQESPFGLYFYGDDHDINNIDMVRSSKNLDTKYLDKSKPTIIWVHGWEDKVFSEYDYELKVGADSLDKGIEQYSYVKKLKELGYNVAAFQYQDKEREKSVAAEDLTAIYKSALIDVQNRGYSMAYMMASELCLNLSDYKMDITYVGHSCGSFVSLSINYYVQYFLNTKTITNNKLLASRISLADPYFNVIGKDVMVGKTIYLTNQVIEKKKNDFFGDVIISLAKNNDVAIDVYLGMGAASNQFRKSNEEVFKNCCVIDMSGLRVAYGDYSIHVLTRDWLFMSLTERNKFIVDNKVAPSLCASGEEIKALRGTWWEQNNKKLNLKTETLTKIDKTAE